MFTFHNAALTAMIGFMTFANAMVSPVFAEMTARGSRTSMTWAITDNTSENIVVAFYSQTRDGHAWPAAGRNWSLKGGMNRFKLDCQSGEKICYGAWNNGNPRGGYWGVGMNNKHGCKGCCHYCDGGTYSESLGN